MMAPVKLARRLRCLAWLSLPSRTGPLSDDWGRRWGTPIDRWYIERFLADHAADIGGAVLEVLDDAYTRRFGRGVTRSEILDIDAANPRATLVADLERPDALPAEAFDCVVLTQTLQYVFDLRAAVANVHRALRPGGVCLATLPVTSKLDPAGRARGEFWRITPDGCARLFAERFGADAVEVTPGGNARASTLFLLGAAAEDLAPAELAVGHPLFPLVVAVRAVRR